MQRRQPPKPPPATRTASLCGLTPLRYGSGTLAGPEGPTTRHAKGHETPGGFAAIAHRLARCAFKASSRQRLTGYLLGANEPCLSAPKRVIAEFASAMN